MKNDPDAAQPAIVSPELIEGEPDRIIIRGLRVQAFVGVHEFERSARQTVVFDVEAETVSGYAEIVRSTGTYVSYADIVQHIEALAASDEHVELLETLAESVAAFVLSNTLVAAVKVTVQKPDIFDNADGVGVVIHRRRDHG